MTNVIALRQCSRCLQDQDPSEFYRERRTCRFCDLKQKADYRARNPDRVKQWIKNNYVKNGKTRRPQAVIWKQENKERSRASSLKCYHARSSEKKMLLKARGRAKEEGLPFNLSVEDIVIPTHCPVLGIELRKGASGLGNPNSPSLDKFIPSLGYVKGNITVISMRANVLKNNASIEEIRKLARWMEAKVTEAYLAI